MNSNPTSAAAEKAPGVKTSADLSVKRPSVNEVLDMFKKGNRDAKAAYLKIKDVEGDIPEIVAALE